MKNFKYNPKVAVYIYSLTLVAILLGALGYYLLTTFFPKLLEDRELNHAELKKHVYTIKDIPEAVIMHCRDSDGRIADVGGKWESTDAIMDPDLPRTILVKACKANDSEWIIKCGIGGFGRHDKIVKVKMVASKWQIISSEHVFPLDDFKCE